jgi:hypothetical protein
MVAWEGEWRQIAEMKTGIADLEAFSCLLALCYRSFIHVVFEGTFFSTSMRGA